MKKAREQAKASKGGACDDATSRSAASTIYASSKWGCKQKQKQVKAFTQLSFDFEANKPLHPWWSGLPCKEMWWFDLLACGCDLNDLSKPWLVENYPLKH